MADTGSKHMSKLLADYHEKEASYGGASWEWHARSSTHVLNQEAKLQALAAAADEIAAVLEQDFGIKPPEKRTACRHSGTCRFQRGAAAIDKLRRLAGRLA